MRDEIDWWLEASQRDVLMAQELLKTKMYEGAAFHAQQAAEKSIKALLLKHSLWVKTHSCVEMLESLAQKGLDTSQILTVARRLDPLYIDARYPNGVGGPPQKFFDEPIAGDALENAQRIVEYVKEQLD